jgi:hypothetical protein
VAHELARHLPPFVYLAKPAAAPTLRMLRSGARRSERFMSALLLEIDMKQPATLTGAVRAEILHMRDGRDFTSADVKQLQAKLAPNYPAVAKVTGTIRCMLQRLRDQGEIEFVAPGRYRRTVDPLS